MNGYAHVVHDPGQVLLNLMLPKAKHLPASYLKLVLDRPVSDDVASQLLLPPPRPRSGNRAVNRASMPKAAIDEHGHLWSEEGEIRSARQSGMHTVPKARRPKRSSQPHFRSGVLRADLGHAP